MVVSIHPADRPIKAAEIERVQLVFDTIKHALEMIARDRSIKHNRTSARVLTLMCFKSDVYRKYMYVEENPPT